jgi:hypothetical protein
MGMSAWVDNTVPFSIQKVKVVMSCNSEKARHFSGTYHLHLQSRRVSQARKHEKQGSATSVGFMVGIFFYPDDGGDSFFCNVTLSPNYMASQPT